MKRMAGRDKLVHFRVVGIRPATHQELDAALQGGLQKKTRTAVRSGERWT